MLYIMFPVIPLIQKAFISKAKQGEKKEGIIFAI